MAWAYLDLPGPNGFAHRGGNVRAPENTIDAFDHAVSLGYRYLETDVHLTRDGVLVAFHDQGLDRVTGKPGHINDHRWSDLADIDLGGGARIPRLDELFETFPGARFNIDPKADAAVMPLAAAILRHRAVDRVCVGSFSDARIDEVRRRVGPELCTSPGPRGMARLVASWFMPSAGSKLATGDPLARGFGAVQIPPTFRGVSLDAARVAHLQSLGLQVHVWTINDEAEMHRLLDMGVDGVMTDETELLRSVMQSRGEWTDHDEQPQPKRAANRHED